LPKTLAAEGIAMNWIHSLVLAPAIASEADALRLAKELNRSAEADGYHVFIDSFLSVRTVLRALWLWLHALLRTTSLRTRSDFFGCAGSSVSLWPFLRKDWWSSLYGVDAIQNCLWLALFDRIAETLPKQSLGLYLCENQSWEFALIYAWRRHDHGRLIGVAHSSIRFWDMRYFFDSRLNDRGDCQVPLRPDHLAVNGAEARAILNAAGQDMRQVVDVEALRYLYLSNSQMADRSANMDFTIRLLVIGDIDVTKTKRMIELVASVRALLGRPLWVTFKPHPASPLEGLSLGSDCHVTDRPIGETLAEQDFILCGNTTTGALDCWVGGIPILIMLDDADFNLSPLRGHENAVFIDGEEELAAALMSSMTVVDVAGGAGNLFWLDADLPRWRTLIGQSFLRPQDSGLPNRT
jgi:surface carbohydrate biosynthesis protein (TIGR04326 family)